MKEERSYNRYALIGLVIVIGLGLVIVLARHGLVDLVRMSAQVDQLERENDDLKQRNKRLMAEIQRLRKNPSAIEEAAREELGLAKPNELVYRFPDDEPAAGSETGDDSGKPGSKNKD